jgi:hypothetical protein
MSALFGSGRIVDVVLALTAVEFLCLVLYRRRTGHGPDVFATLLSGIFLLLALRCATVHAPWQWLALCLTAALVAHLTDLQQRWRAANEQKFFASFFQQRRTSSFLKKRSKKLLLVYDRERNGDGPGEGRRVG